MQVKSIDAILKECSFFAGLPDDILKLLAGCASNVHFDPNTYIFREGEPADAFYVIRKGQAALQICAPGKPPMTIGTVAAEDVLGWSWLFPPYRWHYDAVAMQEVRAISFDGKCLRKKCEEDHDLGYEMMKRFNQIIINRLQGTRIQLLDVYGQ